MFSATFSSLYIWDVPDYLHPHKTYVGSIKHTEITSDAVEASLSEIDISTSIGPDEIHPCLLNAFRKKKLDYLLMFIFRTIYNTCSLPVLWKKKKSLVVPISKKVSRHDLLNYRPVSLTSV